MKNFKMNLNDFCPKESQFTLNSTGDKKYTLCKFSLRVRAWAETQWTHAQIDEIFKKQDVVAMCKIAWFMLKEKESFQNDIERFFDEIGTVKDQFAITTAVFESIGTAEPVIKKLKEEINKAMGDAPPKRQAKRNNQAGEKSTTP